MTEKLKVTWRSWNSHSDVVMSAEVDARAPIDVLGEWMIFRDPRSTSKIVLVIPGDRLISARLVEAING